MDLTLTLHEQTHPSKSAQAAFDELIGLDQQKEELLAELALLLEPGRVEAWRARYHPGGLALIDAVGRRSPLILLQGDVGCGKTALAHSVGTPLAKLLDRRLVTLETPSNLRGTGRVGELSARIAEAFSQATRRAQEVGAAVLIIDEADDVGTSRSQMEAHHEDRAGLNVLIKQIDAIPRAGVALAVVLITNRSGVLDPALLRRASLQLEFSRPDASARRQLLGKLLAGLNLDNRTLNALAAKSRRKPVAYTYSDLTQRVLRLALRRAITADASLSADHVLDAMAATAPSPAIEKLRG